MICFVLSRTIIRKKSVCILISVQFSLKGFFIVNPNIKKTYSGETFHGHCYNALRAKLRRKKSDYGVIIVSTIHLVLWM